MKLDENHPLFMLKEIASILRGENGCAWDKKQTSETLKPYLIEEAYEVYDAIETHDSENLKEELGDLLYQIYAHSQIASEQNLFTVDDVARGISEKLVRRHPHVFGDAGQMSAEEVSDNWEKIKKREKEGKRSLLGGVPTQLPALLKAYRVQQKVSHIGFDWERIEDVVVKLEEELHEFKEVVHSDNRERIEEECGDILFSLVNVLRFVHVNPEEALRKATDKFIDRFAFIEKKAELLGKQLETMTLPEMDELWDEAKREKKR